MLSKDIKVGEDYAFRAGRYSPDKYVVDGTARGRCTRIEKEKGLAYYSPQVTYITLAVMDLDTAELTTRTAKVRAKDVVTLWNEAADQLMERRQRFQEYQRLQKEHDDRLRIALKALGIEDKDFSQRYADGGVTVHTSPSPEKSGASIPLLILERIVDRFETSV